MQLGMEHIRVIFNFYHSYMTTDEKQDEEWSTWLVGIVVCNPIGCSEHGGVRSAFSLGRGSREKEKKVRFGTDQLPKVTN